MSVQPELSPKTAENLQQRMQELANLMSRVSESLHQGDPMELQHLSDEIDTVQSTIQGISRQLEEHPLLADSERYVTRVGDIVESCNTINARQDAIDQLKRLQLVKSFDQNDQESFGQLQDRLGDALHTLTTGTVEERRQAKNTVLNEDSPIRALYEMVNRPEELSDSRWMEAQKMISDAFGSNVAMAVLRGRAR